MLWAQLTAALFMTVPKKLCPLADGSLAEAARGGGGDDIADAGGQLQRTRSQARRRVAANMHTHFYMWEARTRHSALPE